MIPPGYCWRCGKRGLHLCIEIDSTPDWIRRKGRSAMLQWGPFVFWADTSDDGRIGFAFAIGNWMWTWDLAARETLD